MFRAGDGEQLAHRYGFRLANGPIPLGMSICHRCDNPPCQNPQHLFLGEQRDNVSDMDAKGRRRSARLYGDANPNARFTDAQVVEMCAMYRAGTALSEIAGTVGARESVVTKIIRTRGGITGPQRRACGLRNANGKLSPEDVIEIRRAYSSGEGTQSEIAGRFGVSQPTVGSIVRGEAHKTNTSLRS